MSNTNIIVLKGGDVSDGKTSITLKPGTFVARNSAGYWWIFSSEPELSESLGGWLYYSRGGFAQMISEKLFDLTSIPTYGEKDWRKTKCTIKEPT